MIMITIGIEFALLMLVIVCCTDKICNRLDTVITGLSVIIDKMRKYQEERRTDE